jgi:hypothetical protein
MVPLTKFEKIAILHLGAVRLRLFEICRILNRSKSTVRSFQASYEKSNRLLPTRGLPPNEPLPWGLVEDVMHALRLGPRLTLQDEVSRFGLQSLNTTKLSRLLHVHRSHYYKEIAILPLTEDYKLNRMRFCAEYMNFDSDIPIAYTDESIPEMNVQKGGIWRKRGDHIPESFAEKEAHPVQVMVWGGISQGGYRTPLIRCPVSEREVTFSNKIMRLRMDRIRTCSQRS